MTPKERAQYLCDERDYDWTVKLLTTRLINSNLKMWRHNWQWHKNSGSHFALVKVRPLQVVEDICVFGLNGVNYYPQMEQRD